MGLIQIEPPNHDRPNFIMPDDEPPRNGRGWRATLRNGTTKAVQFVRKGIKDWRVGTAATVIGGLVQVATSYEPEHDLDPTLIPYYQHQFRPYQEVKLERPPRYHQEFSIHDDPLSANADGRVQSRLLQTVAMLTGTALHDPKLDITYDARDQHNVHYTGILAPDYVPAIQDWQGFWESYHETVSNVPDTPVANIMRLALPPDSSLAQNKDLVETYLQKYTDSVGALFAYSIVDRRAEQGEHAPYATVIQPLRRMTKAGEFSEFEPEAWVSYQESPEGRYYHNPIGEKDWVETLGNWWQNKATEAQQAAYASFIETLPDPESDAYEALRTHPAILTTAFPTPVTLEHLHDFEAGGARIEPHNWGFDRGFAEQEKAELPRPYHSTLIAKGGKSGALSTSVDTESGDVVQVGNILEEVAYHLGVSLSPSHGLNEFDYAALSHVMLANTLIPDQFPEWTEHDLSRLLATLNASSEGRDDILLAKLDIPLPNLDPDVLQEMLEDHLHDTLTAHGLIAIYGMQLAYDEQGEFAPHAHVYVPVKEFDTRIDANGTWGDIHPAWSNPSITFDALRAAWQVIKEEWDIVPAHQETLEQDGWDNAAIALQWRQDATQEAQETIEEVQDTPIVDSDTANSPTPIFDSESVPTSPAPQESHTSPVETLSAEAAQFQMMQNVVSLMPEPETMMSEATAAALSYEVSMNWESNLTSAMEMED